MLGGSGPVSAGRTTGASGGAWGAGVEGWGLCGGPPAQDASIPTISTNDKCHGRRFMLVILLEALGALLLLVLIVWWTMFSGRDKGELPADKDEGGKEP
jgi:hypothetical protein